MTNHANREHSVIWQPLGALASSIAILLLWIVLTVIASVLYGLVNDQITVTISPEYYSVFKHRQFASILQPMGLMDAPARMLALVVGVIATWWYGLFLGIMLGISSMAGRCPRLSTRRYLRAVFRVIMVTFGISAGSGLVGYLVEPLINPTPDTHHYLTGIAHTRQAFSVGWWHTAGYLGALIATTVVSFQAQRQRTPKREG